MNADRRPVLPWIRLCKIVLVASSAFFLALVVFNNTTDYHSNYQFIQHVLSMDTTFPENSGMWRAIRSPLLFNVFYWTIILWETIACALIGGGVARLWRARLASASDWRKAKALAAVGLTLSLAQWYIAFIAIGGEWFLMWQSKFWNGEAVAFRLFAMMGLGLLFLCQSDDEAVA